jgi:hydrogenase maturation factor
MSCGADHCITCADEATEMIVLRLDGAGGLAWCAADGSATHQLVEVGLIDPVTPGDRILVHAGTAIAALSAEVNT